ncbi:MAG: DUF5679 domain-containing protein [Mycobacteriales bacterium]
MKLDVRNLCVAVLSQVSPACMVRAAPRPAATKITASKRLGGTVAAKAETYNGYCVKCKDKRDFEGQVVTTDSGRRMAKGKCPVCGTTMNRILGKA